MSKHRLAILFGIGAIGLLVPVLIVKSQSSTSHRKEFTATGRVDRYAPFTRADGSHATSRSLFIDKDALMRLRPAVPLTPDLDLYFKGFDKRDVVDISKGTSAVIFDSSKSVSTVALTPREIQSFTKPVPKNCIGISGTNENISTGAPILGYAVVRIQTTQDTGRRRLTNG